jgi:hypothetical protein
MSDTPWTRDPAVEQFMTTFELPADPFIEKLTADRAVIEAVAPRAGEAAPEFRAEKLSFDGRASGNFVTLTDYRGKELALMFGSLTCPIYRGQTDRFNEIFDELQDRLAFLLIYTREAHPEDGWQLGINHSQDVVYDQPTTVEGRAAIAHDCVQQCGLQMTVALDDIDDSIDKKYAGWPERLYIIDANGTVRHRSVPGPFQMDAIEAWYSALKDL